MLCGHGCHTPVPFTDITWELSQVPGSCRVNYRDLPLSPCSEDTADQVKPSRPAGLQYSEVESNIGDRQKKFSIKPNSEYAQIDHAETEIAGQVCMYVFLVPLNFANSYFLPAM